MAYVRKTRVREGVRWVSNRSNYDTPSPTMTGKFPKEVQMIYTEDHPGYRHADGHKDQGGEFESWKVEILNPGIPWTSRYLYGIYQVNPEKKAWNTDTSTFLVASQEIAQLAAQVNALATPDDISAWISNPVRCPQGPNILTMDAMGTKAIDIVKPTSPTVDVATALAELWSERKFFSLPGRSGSLPGEYLNYQFGIAPTLGLAQDLRDTIEHQDAILAQYVRDSERVVRREYRFKPEVTVVRQTSNAPVYGMGHGLSTYQNPGGTLIKRTTTTQRFWFAGAFKYSIPKGAFPRRVAELDHLYGVVPGVSTGWELIPFSWLVDYFSPIGALVSNIESYMTDGLVMPYAYLMSTTEVLDEYDWRGNLRDSGGALRPVGVYSAVRKTRLRRRHATPFGFGLLATDLSPKQLSILAALGLSLRK